MLTTLTFKMGKSNVFPAIFENILYGDSSFAVIKQSHKKHILDGFIMSEVWAWIIGFFFI